MYKIEVFNAETRELQSTVLVNNFDEFPERFLGVDKTLTQALKTMNDCGMDFAVSEVPEGQDSIDNTGIEYELHIESIFSGHVVLKFKTKEFDEEEANALLEVDSISKIYAEDEDFRKLINTISVTESNFDVLLNYLTRVYKFKFTFINFI